MVNRGHENRQGKGDKMKYVLSTHKSYTLGAIVAMSKIMNRPGEFIGWLKSKGYQQPAITEIFNMLDKIQAGDTTIHYGRVI